AEADGLAWHPTAGRDVAGLQTPGEVLAGVVGADGLDARLPAAALVLPAQRAGAPDGVQACPQGASNCAHEPLKTEAREAEPPGGAALAAATVVPAPAPPPPPPPPPPNSSPAVEAAARLAPEAGSPPPSSKPNSGAPRPRPARDAGEGDGVADRARAGAKGAS